MRRLLMPLVVAATASLPATVFADPVELKLSFFSSDRTVAYRAAVKPFVDAINRDGRDVVEIKVYPSGTLGREQKQLPDILRRGKADIAFVIPGQNPELFTDTDVIALPGLFRDANEATTVYTHLATTGALSGYDDFVVIGAYGTAPETINSRKPLATLAELKGQTIRVNNMMQAAALAKLGASPKLLAFNETTPALSRGDIDGATVPSAQLFDVGIGQITGNHYLLLTSSAPLALLMSRKSFDSLPEAAKALIRKYSGAWTADRFTAVYDRINGDELRKLESDPRRRIVRPSASDVAVARAAFAAVRDDWAAKSAHNRELLDHVNAELAKLRSRK
jgi:TRAP-type C4-dicarboxylate transport system substrate-binding protein